MRYIKVQKKLRGCAGSCGIVATINLLKWQGYKVSYKSFTEGTTTRHLSEGMFDKELKKILTAQNIKYRFYRQATISKLINALNKGHSVILGYSWIDKENEEMPHYSFIHGYDAEKFYMENVRHVTTRKAMAHFFQRDRLTYSKKDWPYYFEFTKDSYEGDRWTKSI